MNLKLSTFEEYFTISINIFCVLCVPAYFAIASFTPIKNLFKSNKSNMHENIKCLCYSIENHPALLTLHIRFDFDWLKLKEIKYETTN